MTCNEVWVDIKDYEGYYMISNLGRVKSIEQFLNVLENYT
jgi:hypothetical protein